MPSPVAHMLSGLLIASVPAAINKKVNFKYYIFAAFMAACSDLDMVLVFIGVDYFYAHRTFTHSLILVFIVTFLLWGVCITVRKLLSRTFHVPYIVIGICLICHIGMDLLTVDEYGPQGLMLFWPLSNTFFYPDIPLFDSVMDKHGSILDISLLLLIAVKEISIVFFIGLLLWLFVFTTKRLAPNDFKMKIKRFFIKRIFFSEKKYR